MMAKEIQAILSARQQMHFEATSDRLKNNLGQNQAESLHWGGKEKVSLN